jgi:hypothetical protein
MKPLALYAADEVDLGVIAACLQDAVVRRRDFAFEPTQRRFVFLANRFVWEDGERAKQLPERVRTGVRFDFVQSVQARGLPAEDSEVPLELLTVTADPQPEGAAVVTLVFAGGGAVRLNAECIDCTLEDVSEAWPATMRPDHGLDGGR